MSNTLVGSQYKTNEKALMLRLDLNMSSATTTTCSYMMISIMRETSRLTKVLQNILNPACTNRYSQRLHQITMKRIIG